MTTEERLEKHLSKTPQIAATAYVAKNTTLIGDVSIGENASVWPACVLRGDINSISLGARSNIQDGSIIHLADDYGVAIGEDVTIGHMAMVHACTIEDKCLIGMNATIMDGAVIGEGSIVAAKSLVPKGMKVPPYSLVIGIPATVKRELNEEERNAGYNLSQKYVKVAKAHKEKFQK